MGRRRRSLLTRTGAVGSVPVVSTPVSGVDAGDLTGPEPSPSEAPAGTHDDGASTGNDEVRPSPSDAEGVAEAAPADVPEEPRSGGDDVGGPEGDAGHDAPVGDPPLAAEASQETAPSEPEPPDRALRPSGMETVDLGTEPLVPPGFADASTGEIADAPVPPADDDAEGSEPSTPKVRFVAHREMLLGWRPPRKRPRGRAFVTLAELQMAAAITGLAVVMLIVGFVGLIVVYVGFIH